MIIHSISLTGKRESNEDQHTIFLNLDSNDDKCNPINLFSVFDGHGGNITTGLLEFILQHGATIAGGTPVDSQWILGGTSTYYPSQANYCEWCNYDSTGTAQYWTTSDTSPIGTTNWLMDEGPGACSCC